MAGLIVVSFRSARSERAEAAFERACEAYTAVKGLARTAVETGPGFRLARFASPNAACPGIHVRGDTAWAAAGWWFDPQAPVAKSSMELLAAQPEGDRALARLEGQFLIVRVAALGNGHRLRAAIDRVGLFPAYVAGKDDFTLISTSALALASALDASIEPEALWALFLGDAVRSPKSAFAGVRRLGIGEQAVCENGALRIERVWTPYVAEGAYRRVEDAAEAGIAILERTCAEIRERWPRWVADLTSGLDSRLLVAGLASGQPVHTTVNGPPDHIDVRTSRVISESFGWKSHNHQLPPDWGSARWRCFRMGVALSDGELSGEAMDRAVAAKLALRDSFACSASGGGAELLRGFLWSQEFLRIGRSKTVDVDRLLSCHFFMGSEPGWAPFKPGWLAAYRADQEARIRQHCDMQPDALNTAKLDAVYLWKSSGHCGRYQGALHPLIVSVVPLLSPGLAEFGLSVPWRYRVYGSVLRHMIHRMSPRLAAFPTWYGSSARPFSLRRPRDIAGYGATMAQKLIRKVGQATIRRPIFKNPTAPPADPKWELDFASTLRREGLLDVENLRTAHLYQPDKLRRLLQACREEPLRHMRPLYALASAEYLARTAADPRSAKAVFE